MAQITRSTKIGGGTVLQSNTVARATDVETDVLALFNEHNNHDSGNTTWGTVSAENATSTPLIANNAAGTNDIFDARDNGSSVFKVVDGGDLTLTGSTLTASSMNATIQTVTPTKLDWRGIRGIGPGLSFVSVTQVDILANSGVNETTIIFPDGTTRSVTEDTSVTNVNRRFDITAVAEFTSGTEDSGLRSGITEADNTWYGLYAVKSQINSANFVMAGDTTLYSVSNIATLDSRYGTDSWVYLGMIRNGDSGSTAGDILNFTQLGATTILINNLTGENWGSNSPGLQIATSASATALIYTRTVGTGDTDIPANLEHILWIGAINDPSAAQDRSLLSSDSGQTYIRVNSDDRFSGQIWASATKGLTLQSTTSAVGMDIIVHGWVDTPLADRGNILI